MDNRGVNSTSLTAVTQLGYIGIGVSDLEAWREFGTQMLGLQENGTSANGSLYFRMDENHHRFEIFPTGEDDLLYAGWEAKDAKSMRAVADQVRALGVDVTEATTEEAAERMVLGLVKFKDPNGIATEVYYGPYLDSKPVNLPRAISGFKAADCGLGHIFLQVDDLDESLRFYMEGLGVKLSDYIKFTAGQRSRLAAFTHVNGRHHSLAMAPRAPAAPGAPAAPQRRLGHFMIEVKSLDDVGYTLSVFQQRGMPCGQLGKHSNDRMISFYAPTPSGFQVEFGTGGRLIDDDVWEVQQYSVASFWGHGMPPAPKPPEQAPQAAAKPAPATA